MRIDDRTQNLPARIRTVQIIVLALLSTCVVRLYNLQIVHSDYYHERAINQRLRTLPIPAPRGTILDRNGKVLVNSRPVYDVVLQRERGKQIDKAALLPALPEVLDLDPEYLKERLSEISTNPRASSHSKTHAYLVAVAFRLETSSRVVWVITVRRTCIPRS